MFNTQYIQGVQFLESLNDEPDWKPLNVDIDQARDKEDRILKQMIEDAAKIGIGVSREGQEIFLALCKT
jgi:hypothetical protein